MTGARIDTPLGEMVVGDRLEVPRGDQFRHIRVGDIIVGREDPPGCGWNEAILRCAWVGDKRPGKQVVVWDVWTRKQWSLTRLSPQEWHDDGQQGSWVLDGRPWFRLTPTATTDTPRNALDVVYVRRAGKVVRVTLLERLSASAWLAELRGDDGVTIDISPVTEGEILPDADHPLDPQTRADRWG